jgi:1-acyl-sn-glycerol-3-phosphate acyltransferase
MTVLPELRARLRQAPRFSPFVLESGKRLARPPINRALLQVRVTGRELVPTEGPVLLAGNHRGWLDGPLVVIEAPRPVRCLVKSEVFVGPFGHFLHLIGQIPVDRSRPDRGALSAAVNELHDGGAVGVFPEGSRGTGELTVVHDGIAYLAMRGDCPIVPVACLGTAEVWAAGATASRGPVDVVFGAPFEVELPENRHSRKALSDLSEQIRGRLLDHLADARRTRAVLQERGIRVGDLSADLEVST